MTNNKIEKNELNESSTCVDLIWRRRRWRNRQLLAFQVKNL